MTGVLSGVKIVEFEGIGPAPYAGMLLADMGADVVRVLRPGAERGPLIADTGDAVLDRGKTRVPLDLKAPNDLDMARALIAAADGLIEGLRPGAMERLGLGPEEARALNSALVYLRVTGWGQTGPLSQTAGHDINYIALSGALHAIGDADRPPPPPLNLVGDFGGGGMMAAMGMLGGLIDAARTGQGTVIDSAMLDGAISQMALIHAWAASGLWQDRRQANLLDGAAPFYRCYVCSDGKFVAVGAIEPQFFGEFLVGLGIDPAGVDQADRSGWPALAARIAAIFATRPRDDWAAHFDGTDACVSPVLSISEAPAHPHNAERGSFSGPLVQGAAAPRFGGAARQAAEPPRTSTSADVLARWRQAPPVFASQPSSS